jgi:hypothetical protein
MLLAFASAQDRPYHLKDAIPYTVIMVMDIHGRAAVPRYILHLLQITEFILAIGDDAMFLIEFDPQSRVVLDGRQSLIRWADLQPRIGDGDTLAFMNDRGKHHQGIPEP